MSDTESVGTECAERVQRHPNRLHQFKTVYLEQLRIFRRSKLLYIYLGLLLIIPFFGLTFLRILYNEFDLHMSAVRLIMYILPLAMSILVPRIAGNPLQDEYSRNTAYSTFTTPVSRSTMYVGKFLAAYTLITILFIGIYVMAILTGHTYASHDVRDVWDSLLICLVGVFAISGTTYGISAHINKGAVPLTMVANLSIPILFMVFLVLFKGSFLLAVEYMLDGAWDLMKILPPFMGYNATYALNTNIDGTFAQTVAAFTVYSGPLYHLLLFSTTWGLMFLYAGHRRFKKKDM